jgi:predicted MFS family arabinose efflux permease
MTSQVSILPGESDPLAPIPVSTARSNFAVTLLVVISVAFLAASSAPTPLYAIYQHDMALSPLVVTIIFAAYPVAFLIALLVVGSLSDHAGRRVVIMAAVALEVGAIVLFLVSSNPGELIAARALQGVATGAATAAIGAALTDLAPARAPIFNSVAPLIGMATGAVGAAALATWVQQPTIVVFAVMIALFAILLIAARFLPETSARRPGAFASLRVAVLVPAASGRALAISAPILIAVWALGGFLLSLGPSLLHAQTGSFAPLPGGWLVFALTATGTIAVVVLRSHTSERVFIIGAVALTSGLIVVLTSVVLSSPTILFIGTAIAGIGFGSGFQGAMRTVMSTADPSDRAGLLSTVFVISYLAMSIPAIGAGLLSAQIGIETTTYIVGGVAIALSLIALVAILRRESDESISPRWA